MVNSGRRILVVFLDSIMFYLAMLAAYFIRFEMNIPEREWQNISYFMPYGLGFLLVAFYFGGIYSTVWRYTSVRDIWVVIRSVSVVVGGLVAVSYMSVDTYIARSIAIMLWVFLIICIGASRVGWRIYAEWRWGKYQFRNNGKIGKRTLIIGAGDAGVMTLREMMHSPTKMIPIAFLDDDPLKQGKAILGFRVIGTTANIESVVEEESIEEIIIAMPSVSGSKIREIVEACNRTGIPVKTLPSFHDLLSGKVNVTKLRSIDVEDLLRRDPVNVDFQNE